MQFGFMSGSNTTEDPSVLFLLQEKHVRKHKPLYFAFSDLEKAFHLVPSKVFW